MMTKKELQKDIESLKFALSDLIMELTAKNIISGQPKLKTLDQSVFDGLDEKWQFAAVDKGGKAYKFRFEAKVSGDGYFCDEGYHKYSLVGEGYNPTFWQDSLIERESELTGNDLCNAMFARGDKYVMCMAGDGTDVIYDLACSVSSTYPYIGRLDNYRQVTPIDNQGEPLTAKDVGL